VTSRDLSLENIAFHYASIYIKTAT